MKKMQRQAPWNDEKRLKKQFSFLCNATKDMFSNSSQDGVHFCAQCQKNVYEVHSQEDFTFHATRNNCVLVQTAKNNVFIAKPDKKTAFYLRCDTPSSQTFGPYFESKSRRVQIASENSAHIVISPSFEAKPVELILHHDTMQMVNIPQGEIKLRTFAQEEAISVEATEITLSDADVFYIKTINGWIGFTVIIEDHIPPPPVILGGQVLPPTKSKMVLDRIHIAIETFLGLFRK